MCVCARARVYVCECVCGVCVQDVFKNLRISFGVPFSYSYNGIVNVCQHLLATSHKYVKLGQFSTDPLENKNFSDTCK